MEKVNEKSSKSKSALIKCTSNPQPLSMNEIQTFLDLFHKRIFEKDTILINQGDKWNRIFFIDKGIIRLFMTAPDGQEFNKNFFAEENFFWPATPGTRLNSSLFSVATLELSHIWIADFPIFQEHLKKYNRWEAFALLFTEALADQKFTREYEFLMFDAENAFREKH